MKIVVCAKVIKGELNPFDEAAIECALRLSDDVTVISMAPMSAETVLKPLTRLGAKVILISDSLYAGSDTLATAYILSVALSKMEYDLILCGRQSVDGDTSQVGPMLSQMLGIAVCTNAMAIEKNEEFIEADTRQGRECMKLPALITMERNFVLRFPSIFSRPGEVEIWDNSYIGCDESKCGLNGSPTRVIKTFENEKGKRRCKFITFDNLFPLIEELKKQTVKKVQRKLCKKKLKYVWTVGEEVSEKAKEIGEKVIVIEKSEPKLIAERIMSERPDVVLWNADVWGRKNAPIVAAMLNTGLCADCTELETEDDNLIMYRPAQGGSIYAKIKCLTKPQMATVRTKAESADIIVSCGRGIADNLEKAHEFAEKIGASVSASRALVDTGKAPYDMQVGLTGKTVSPKIYIAIGISGAVQHTCAIEGAETIIAINSDKNARIFEYADYGIVCSDFVHSL